MNTAPIVSKVWSFCTTLRDDGVGYGDYLEQLTYLIFLKMADEYLRRPARTLHWQAAHRQIRHLSTPDGLLVADYAGRLLPAVG